MFFSDYIYCKNKYLYYHIYIRVFLLQIKTCKRPKLFYHNIINRNTVLSSKTFHMRVKQEIYKSSQKALILSTRRDPIQTQKCWRTVRKPTNKRIKDINQKVVQRRQNARMIENPTFQTNRNKQTLTLQRRRCCQLSRLIPLFIEHFDPAWSHVVTVVVWYYSCCRKCFVV